MSRPEGGMLPLSAEPRYLVDFVTAGKMSEQTHERLAGGYRLSGCDELFERDGSHACFRMIWAKRSSSC